jgi:hypothetical protein
LAIVGNRIKIFAKGSGFTSVFGLLTEAYFSCLRTAAEMTTKLIINIKTRLIKSCKKISSSIQAQLIHNKLAFYSAEFL